MIRICPLIVWFLLSCLSLARSQGQNQAPDFKEVYETIRAHLEGASEPELNRTAVQGLVSALAPKVSLVMREPAAGSNPAPSLVIKTSLFDGDLVYLRIGRVTEGLDLAMRDGLRQLTATNKLNGVVLDLRYTGGDDYDAAANAMQLFLNKEKPLLDSGHGVVSS